MQFCFFFKKQSIQIKKKKTKGFDIPIVYLLLLQLTKNNKKNNAIC
jgi:hypothetical protein